MKSVLVIAGPLKRAEPNVDEKSILMRSLRDTNLAKLSKDDVDIFRKLVQALFPNQEIAPKRNQTLTNGVRSAIQRQVFAAQGLELPRVVGVI